MFKKFIEKAYIITFKTIDIHYIHKMWLHDTLRSYILQLLNVL